MGEAQQLLDGKAYDPYFFVAQPLYDEHIAAVDMTHDLRTQLNREYYGNFLKSELNEEYKKWSGEVEQLGKELAAMPIILT